MAGSQPVIPVTATADAPRVSDDRGVAAPDGCVAPVPSAWQLPDTLDYEGEFGAELLLFLPFVTWLSKAGWLRSRRLRIYQGMRCFYDDLDCLELLEKNQLRLYLPPEQRLASLPVKDEHTFDGIGRSPFHMDPDLRRKFAALPISAAIEMPARPLLIVHNKHNTEWMHTPVNFISLHTLDAMFRALTPHFTVVYIRHPVNDTPVGFSADLVRAVPFDDRSVLAQHPDVWSFDDIYATYKAAGGPYDVNTFKNVLYSRCYRFISSQGGGAHHIACFSGSLLMVLHRKGSEDQWAYRDGYYRFVSNPAPRLAICRNEADLIRGLDLFIDSAVCDRQILLASRHERLLHQLSASTLSDRQRVLRSSS